MTRGHRAAVVEAGRAGGKPGLRCSCSCPQVRDNPRRGGDPGFPRSKRGCTMRKARCEPSSSSPFCCCRWPRRPEPIARPLRIRTSGPTAGLLPPTAQASVRSSPTTRCAKPAARALAPMLPGATPSPRRGRGSNASTRLGNASAGFSVVSRLAEPPPWPTADRPAMNAWDSAPAVPFAPGRRCSSRSSRGPR